MPYMYLHSIITHYRINNYTYIISFGILVSLVLCVNSQGVRVIVEWQNSSSFNTVKPFVLQVKAPINRTSTCKYKLQGNNFIYFLQSIILFAATYNYVRASLDHTFCLEMFNWKHIVSFVFLAVTFVRESHKRKRQHTRFFKSNNFRKY